MHERASTVVSKIRLSEKPNVLISMASIPSISSFPLPVYVLLKINLCLQSSQNVLFNSISTVAVCDENSDVTCIIWLQRELEHWSSTVSSGLDFNLTSQKIEYILWFKFLSFSSSSLYSNWLNTSCKNMLRYSGKRRLKHTPPPKKHTKFLPVWEQDVLFLLECWYLFATRGRWRFWVQPNGCLVILPDSCWTCRFLPISLNQKLPSME